MTLLDRFFAQSRDKHPDPAVRLAYVADIPLEEREAIASIARTDEDARVRRAAVAKLMDPASLGAVARSDADEGVRAQASAMLRDIALEAFEGVSETESLEAVEALADSRVLGQIARTSGRELVALRALSRISDVHLLGSAARHAALEAVRRDAFERVRGDHGEVVAIAMNGEYRDTASAAVDAVSPDRAVLEQIAARSRNRYAVKRARTLLREADEAAAREAAEAAAAEAEARAEAEEKTRAAEAEARARAEAEAAANAGQSAGPIVGPSFSSGAPDGVTGGATGDATAGATTGASTGDPVLHEEPVAVQPQPDEEAAERRRARIEAAVAQAEAAAAEADLKIAHSQIAAARRAWDEAGGDAAADDELRQRWNGAAARLRSRDADARDIEGRARREALARVQQLLARVEPLAAKPDLTLKAGERALRDVRTLLAAVPPLPSRQDFEDVSARLKAVLAALTPRVQELRDADDWQRWANVTVQEQLCAQMEALAAVDDPEKIARDVRALQQQWRQAADVPRARADALWRRFKTAHDQVWAKCEAHFAAQAQERAANLARKVALCEQAESLAESTAWLQTAEAIKRLQAEWKAIGPVSRGREKAVWERFRTACDRFFTRRHEDLAQRKTLWAANLARKDALCVRAEALAESTDWEAAAAEIRRLQAEWKTIGPVKKTRSEAVWQRFRGACDRFFARYAQRHDTARAERVAAREAICAELEALAGADPSAAPADPSAAPADPSAARPPAGDLASTVRALRSRWQQELTARGVDPDRAAALNQRFAAAMAAVQQRHADAFAGTDLDPNANQKRLEALVRKVEDLAGSIGGGSRGGEQLSSGDRLAAMLKEALAANTIGGKVDDDSRARAALDQVRQAQASWSRIGPVPDDTRRALSDRFQRAIRQITDSAQKGRQAGQVR